MDATPPDDAPRDQPQGRRHYVDRQGHAVNERGERLVGMPPMDSQEYYDFICLMRRTAIDRELGKDPEYTEAKLAPLEDLIRRMPDAGEREDAASDLADLREVLSRRPVLSPEYEQAVDVRLAAGDAGGTPAERIAALEEGIRQMLAIADSAEPEEAMRIRIETSSLYRIIEGLRMQQDH